MAGEFKYRFSTKYRDVETGLDYNDHRYYHPDLGRWMSRDWIGEFGGLMLYGYCINNSFNRYDPKGMKSCPDYSPLWVLTGAPTVPIEGGYACGYSFAKDDAIRRYVTFNAKGDITGDWVTGKPSDPEPPNNVDDPDGEFCKRKYNLTGLPDINEALKACAHHFPGNMKEFGKCMQEHGVDVSGERVRTLLCCVNLRRSKRFNDSEFPHKDGSALKCEMVGCVLGSNYPAYIISPGYGRHVYCETQKCVAEYTSSGGMLHGR
jgi:RHS repeat-associated protein